jgi:TetR/AcrR family transcriptional regulator
MKKTPSCTARHPDRTRRRILAAALQEFSTLGFAGTRISGIARRAKINKQMLYYYFGGKEELFRAVLRHKMDERMNRIGAHASEAGLAFSLPVWFQQNCLDADWVRLVVWESLQNTGDTVLDEKECRLLIHNAINDVRKKQAAGQTRNDLRPQHLVLAKVSLAVFPLALPLLAKLVVGCSPRTPRFQREYTGFLKTLSAVFHASTAERPTAAAPRLTVDPSLLPSLQTLAKATFPRVQTRLAGSENRA